MIKLSAFRLDVLRASIFLTLTATLAAAGGYHLLKSIPITGDYGWD